MTVCVCKCSVEMKLQRSQYYCNALVCIVCVCIVSGSTSYKRVLCCSEKGGTRGWQPSVTSVRPGTLRAVSFRIAEGKWNTLYPRSPAGQLWQGCPSITEYQHLSSPPLSPFLLLSSSCSLQCLCVLLCEEHAERKNREESGGRVASTYNRLPGDSIQHKEEFPELYTSVYCLDKYRICFLSATVTADCMFYWLRHENRASF